MGRARYFGDVDIVFMNKLSMCHCSGADRQNIIKNNISMSVVILVVSIPSIIGVSFKLYHPFVINGLVCYSGPKYLIKLESIKGMFNYCRYRSVSGVSDGVFSDIQ